jgi:hypothetical protein
MKRFKEVTANIKVRPLDFLDDRFDPSWLSPRFARDCLQGLIGTWIPLQDGRNLAERNGVLEKLLPILDYVAGDRSPPPAPKHATATSSRPRAPRQSAAARRASGKTHSMMG